MRFSVISALPVRLPTSHKPIIITSVRINLTYLYYPRADFWGPVSNFGIPIAAIMDTQKDPEMYVSNPRASFLAVGQFKKFPL